MIEYNLIAVASKSTFRANGWANSECSVNLHIHAVLSAFACPTNDQSVKRKLKTDQPTHCADMSESSPCAQAVKYFIPILLEEKVMTVF